MGRVVDLGGRGRGYLASPEKGAGPALLVIQEYWGLVPHIEDVCERFAIEGFTALAPDLFRGAVASEPDEAGKLMMSLNLDQAADDLGAAVGHLAGSPAVRGEGVGVVGFSMGGGLALMLSTTRPMDIRACVCFYGLIPWPAAAPDWSRLRAPVQGHFAEQDEFFSIDRMEELEARFGVLGKDAEFFRYPGVGHAFFNDTRSDAYDETAASMAWTRTLEFLRAKLG